MRLIDIKPNKKHSVTLLIGVVWGVCCTSAYALQWQIRPNISLSEAYDDNLNLSQYNKKGGATTELDPGFLLTGVSPLSNFNMNYRLQGLYNAENSDAVDVYHQLKMNTLYQPIQNTFFIKSSSTISQQNATNSLLATDNVSGKRNVVQSETFNLTPYLTPHFGQYAVGSVKAGYTGGYVDNPASSTTATSTTNAISNSHTILKQIGLTSGSYFRTTSWGLNYQSTDQQNSTGGDVIYQQVSNNFRYYIDRTVSVFYDVGYQDNQYQTLSPSSIKNGYYYTIGAKWQPSLWYSTEVGVGNNSHVTVTVNPNNNFNSNVTYNYRAVGLNPGSTWNADVNYKTLYTKFGFKFEQDTSTVQEMLSNQDVFSQNPITGVQNVLHNIALPNLVNDVIVAKTANLNFTYTLGKSSYNASAYNTIRNYQISQELDTIYGITAGWHWQVVPRLTYYLQPFMQMTDSNLKNAATDYYGMSTGITRGIPVNFGRPMQMKSTFELRHIEQMSTVQGSSYMENRATVSFNVQY